MTRTNSPLARRARQDLVAVDPAPLSPERHASDLEALGAREFDLLVVGGGIIGAGIALDASARGLGVAVVEAQDWAAGSSSRSSKLVHGGLRYLEQHHFSLVREALRERATLMRTAPQLVHPVSFILPLSGGLAERAYVGAGLALYDALGRGGPGGSTMPGHTHLTRARAQEIAPALNPRTFSGAIQYSDAQVDDARHTMSVVRTAASYGAVATSRVRVVDVLQSRGRVVGARVLATEISQELEVRARVVVSATGVWTQPFQALVGGAAKLAVQPSKGVHLVVARESIDSSTALILRTAKSVLFVLPWGEHWIIGTTDTTWKLDVSRPAASSADIDYLLSMINRVLLRPLTLGDIESVFVGLRPLIADGGSDTTALSREHAIARPLPGLVVVSGGKYTTYRSIAAEVVDAALDHGAMSAPASSTSRLVLVGGASFDEIQRKRLHLAATSGLSVEEIDRLLARYGDLITEVLAEADTDPLALSKLSRSGGYLRAEISYAVSHEGARHLDDVVARRTRLSMEARDRGVEAAPEIASIMASRLGWDAVTSAREVEAYTALVSGELAGEQEHDDEAAAMRVTSALPSLET